jgi:hypothetical protein
MRRKPVHLIAAIVESFRFFAIAFLAYSIGATGSASVSGLLRYAAAPQILFAAGFFFLWLDPTRYRAYRPLLLLGKAACLVCFLPMGVAVAADPASRGLSLGVPALGFGLAFLIAIVDILSLSVLILVRNESAPTGPAAPSEAEAPKSVGQSPDEIERVEV